MFTSVNMICHVMVVPVVCTGVLLLGGLMYRSARFCWALIDHAARRQRSIQARMEITTSFEEWQALASDLDAIREHTKQSGPAKELYDETLLAAKVAELDSLRSRGRVQDLMFVLRSDLYRDFGNITNRCATVSHQRLSPYDHHDPARRHSVTMRQNL
jgi:hypothetical protein